MPILDEIEAFFAVQSNWQRHAYAALRAGVAIDEKLLSEITLECEKEAFPRKTKPLPKVVSPESTLTPEPTTTIRVLGIEKVQHIDNLAPEQALHFATDGLSVVYGDNGAGKTGYGRILRQVCAARGSVPLLRGNVFVASEPPGSAEIVFSIDGVEDRTFINMGQTPQKQLRSFSIFDTGAAASLVNEQNATAFRPFGLDLLDKFTVVADSIKGRIEQHLSQTENSLLQIEDYPETTTAGRIIRDLGSESTRKNIVKYLMPLSPEQETRRAELGAILAQAKIDDPTKLAQAVNAKATRYHQFSQRLNAITVALHNEKIVSFTALRKECQETETAADIARNDAFSKEFLKEICGGVWLKLWEAAREYSLMAQAGHSLASAEAGDRCLLCAQPLGDEAAARMRTLEAFVEGNLQAKAKALRKQLNNAMEEFDLLPFQQAGDEALLQELKADDESVADAARSLLEKAREITQLLQVHHKTGEALPAGLELQSSPPALGAMPSTLRQRAVELQKSATASTLLAQQAEFAELEAQARLAQQAELVKNEANRILIRKGLEIAKKSTFTRAVSELSKELTIKYVSQALCERFRAELQRLGLDNLQVELASAGAQKGKLFHRISLKAKREAPLREVVSEGEFRCLALAGFLAEVGGNNSGILFDDPVSSLDHTWRNRIAIRLANEALKRQVIVFTHDIVFHFLLREAAESPNINVSFSERCVERRGNAGAGYCREDAPWAGMKISKRIGVLKNELPMMKKKFEAGDTLYEREVRDWYGRLRESWERSIEECLLNDAVRRFSHSIQTNRLEKALQKINAGDWVAIEKGMTRASSALRGHDGAAGLNSPIPTPSEAAQDLAEFETWVKTKN